MWPTAQAIGFSDMPFLINEFAKAQDLADLFPEGWSRQGERRPEWETLP